MKYSEVVEYLENNEELFNRLIEELDSWNGYLGDDRWYEMYDLNDLLYGKDFSDVLIMAHNGDFNPNDNYFKINCYGNLESAYEPDYSDYLDECFVKELVSEQNHIDIDDSTLEDMLRELERGEYE